MASHAWAAAAGRRADAARPASGPARNTPRCASPCAKITVCRARADLQRWTRRYGLWAATK
eukprot:9903529-Alexandrium_andersonii.AAC.1